MSEQQELNRVGLSVGAMLRERRIARGIGLDEVARVTRIGKAYLEAIEDDRLDKLPSGAYSRGFIRQYAQYLGVAEADITLMLTPPVPDHGEPEQDSDTLRPVRNKRRTVNARANWLVSALLLAVVGVIALLTGDRRPDPVQRASAPGSGRQPVAQPAVTPPVQHAASSSQREKPLPEQHPPGAPAGARPEAITPETGVVLRLKVVTDSWLTITIDDSLSQQYDLKNGDVIEWKGERVFVLDVGNGAAFEGEFNGRPIQSLGEAGKPAHRVLTTDAQGAQ